MDPEERIARLEAALVEYGQHGSWRCSHYNDCHCGLDEVTDDLGLERIPKESR